MSLTGVRSGNECVASSFIGANIEQYSPALLSYLFRVVPKFGAFPPIALRFRMGLSQFPLA